MFCIRVYFPGDDNQEIIGLCFLMTVGGKL